MKKRNVVKSKLLFNKIIQQGKRLSNRYYIINYIYKDDENSKFGFAVGKKIGSAVTRNKLKRQLRCIVDNNLDLFKKNYDYIIMCKKDILKIKYQQMEQELINLIKGDINEK